MATVLLRNLRLVGEDGTIIPAENGTRASSGAVYGLRVSPASDAAEPFVVYIAEQNGIFDRVEMLTVSWYVTGGELDRASQSRAGGDPGDFEANWSLPAEPGMVDAWVVLRDERGGSDWRGFSLLVE